MPSASEVQVEAGIWGLIRSMSVSEEVQSQTRKGLPNYIKIVGSNKLARGEISGDVTSATSVSVSHSSLTSASVTIGSTAVTGVLASLRISGSKNSIVSFSATVIGKKGAGAAAASDPGDPVFCEDAIVNGESVVDFSLDLSWNIEPLWDKNGDNYPYPESYNLAGFDGRFSYSIDATSGTLSNSEVTFSINVGGISISGTAKEVGGETTTEVDGLCVYKKNLIVVSLG